MALYEWHKLEDDKGQNAKYFTRFLEKYANFFIIEEEGMEIGKNNKKKLKNHLKTQKYPFSPKVDVKKRWKPFLT